MDSEIKAMLARIVEISRSLKMHYADLEENYTQLENMNIRIGQTRDQYARELITAKDRIRELEIDLGKMTSYLAGLDDYVNITVWREGWEALPKHLQDMIFPPLPEDILNDDK